jgi:uncharacterized OB-fold protein
MSKLRAIGSDDRYHDAVLCKLCGSVVILEERDCNDCPKKGCDAEYDGNGNLINFETDQQKEDRRYVQSGLDNLWDLTEEEYSRYLRGK